VNVTSLRGSDLTFVPVWPVMAVACNDGCHCKRCRGITAENVGNSRHVRPDLLRVMCVGWMTSRFVAGMTWLQTLARHCVTYRMNNT